MKNGADTAADGVNFGRLLTVLQRWWWLAVLIALVSVGVAYAFLERMTPRYRATATVVVSPKSMRIMADVKDIVDLPDGGRRDFGEYAETQLEIIRSQTVATLVLDEKDWWDDERLFKPTPEDAELPAETLRLKRASLLAKRIKASRVPDSLTIQIQFEHEDPELAAAVSNAAAAAYVQQNLSLKRKMLDRASHELKMQVAKQKIEKVAAEAKLAELERKMNITAVATRLTELAGDRSYFNEQRRKAEREAVATAAHLDQINEAKKAGVFGIAVQEVITNPVLNTLKVRYAQLQNEVTDVELVFGPKHHKLRGARKRLKQVRHAIRLETKGILSEAKSRHTEAVQQQTNITRRFDETRLEHETLSLAMAEHEQLAKDLKETVKFYDRLRKRFEETGLTTSLAEASNNVRLLDRALVPTRAVWPRRTPIMAGSAVFGLLLGVLLIALLDRADTTIRDKQQAEDLLGVPCLGLVPTITLPSVVQDLEGIRTRDLFVYHNSLSEPAEQARTLRTNLLFLSAERQLKTLLVTSALPEEGKTTIAIQTSITLAAAGGRTVLIEADMRRPRLAATLEVRDDTGLSSYLANRDTEVADVVQQTAVPNLDVIVCGLIPPNPAELLNSLRLNQLIAKLHEQYAIVVIDSPPVNAVSDALVMASRVDGVLLVAKSKRTTREALSTAYRSLLNVDAPVIGTVLNDLRRAAFGYYRRGKYYRKGYYRRSPEELEEQLREQRKKA